MNPLNIIKSLIKIKVNFVESLKISGQRVKEKIKKMNILQRSRA